MKETIIIKRKLFIECHTVTKVHITVIQVYNMFLNAPKHSTKLLKREVWENVFKTLHRSPF